MSNIPAPSTTGASTAETTPVEARPVAIVTGASRGIGRGIAEHLVATGHRVCLTGRDTASLANATEELGGADLAIGVAGGSDDSAHQERTVTAALEAFGRLDHLVNNAGINPVYGDLLGVDHAAARKTFDVNCWAPLAWTQRVVEAWMGENGGSIVNVASTSGVRSHPGIGFYGATKAMLIQLTAQLATELGPRVRVNAVAPSIVRTAFASALYEGRQDAVVARYPLRRLGTPDDVAGAVGYLLSEQASWTTGQTLVVDGGITLAGGA